MAKKYKEEDDRICYKGKKCEYENGCTIRQVYAECRIIDIGECAWQEEMNKEVSRNE